MLSSKPAIYQLASNGIGPSNRLEDKLLVPGQLEEPAQVLFWIKPYMVRLEVSDSTE